MGDGWQLGGVGWGGMGCGLGKHPLGSCPYALPQPRDPHQVWSQNWRGTLDGPRAPALCLDRPGWAAGAGWAQSPALGKGGNGSPCLMVLACPLAGLAYFLITLCKPETGQASEGLAVPERGWVGEKWGRPHLPNVN